VLAAGVGLLSSALGASAAWLVVMHRFPGRGLFEWLLALPLAAPAYALAYAYADLLDVAGPVRTALRGAGVEAAFLDARSLPGAVLILSAAFYPYVYLTARSAFVSQSVCALEASRTLGCGPWSAFSRVALPLARPAIAAGAALVLMETLAEYGAVSFLGVQTLTTGVVRSFSAYGSAESAARLSLILLARRRHADRHRAERPRGAGVRRLQRALARAAAVSAARNGCRRGDRLLPAVANARLLLPCAWLAFRGLQASPDLERLARAGGTSLWLAAAGCVATTALAR
jgi:iron(III) transport system permease protein